MLQAFETRWPDIALDSSSAIFEDVVDCLTSYTIKNGSCATTEPLDPMVLPQGFNDWVAYRLKFYETTSGFAQMLRERTDSDLSAIELLFDIVQQFHSRTKRIVAKFSDTVVVVYTDDPGFFLLSANGPEVLRKSFIPTVKAFEIRTGIAWSSLDVVDQDWKPTP